MNKKETLEKSGNLSERMMGHQKWKSLLLKFICLLLSFSHVETRDVVESSSEVSTRQPRLFEKYICDLSSELSVVTHSPRRSDRENVRANKTETQPERVTLSCPKDHVLYKNITEQEFMESEYNGVLELLSLRNTSFEKGKFCVATIYNNSLESRNQTLKLALCDDKHEHVDHVQSVVASAPSTIIIRKCCKRSQRLEAYSFDEKGNPEYNCVDIPPNSTQSKWKPAIFNRTSDDYSDHKDLEDFQDSFYRFGLPECSGVPHSLNNSKDIWFMLLEDGSVQIGLKFWFKPVWLPVKDNKFCLDEVVDHDPSSLNDTTIDSHAIYHKNQILLYCEIANFDDYLFHRRLFGSMCVSAAGVVFILLIIYVSIWDKQNLAGWTQFNIFFALFFVVLMEGLRTIVDANALLVQSSNGCIMIAAVAQYFFFALNTTWTVMCFDLFFMFWKLETTSKSVARYRNRLICYLTFSWGLPLLVVCTAFYFSHSSATEDMSEMKGVYAFAHRRCSSPIRKLGFQTQGIMFLVNLVFFLCTTALIWKHRRGLNPAKLKTRNERHTWRSVCLFMKLVVVMGVTSLSIPLDYFFGSSEPISSIAILFRMIHFIPFFAVLFIFGFNEKNVALISQKYPRFGKYFRFIACTSQGASASDTANHSRSGNVNRISDHPSSPT